MGSKQFAQLTWDFMSFRCTSSTIHRAASKSSSVQSQSDLCTNLIYCFQFSDSILWYTPKGLIRTGQYFNDL